jgi:hypothetical protein
MKKRRRKDKPMLNSVLKIPPVPSSHGQKRLITVVIGVAMFFSPMTANIYLLQLINLTVTA